MNPSLFALNALNFFMADVAGGLGPFLGVFLQAKHRRGKVYGPSSLEGTNGAGCDADPVSSWQRRNAAAARTGRGRARRQRSQRIHRGDHNSGAGDNGADGVVGGGDCSKSGAIGWFSCSR
jgi:hypothetical protein